MPRSARNPQRGVEMKGEIATFLAMTGKGEIAMYLAMTGKGEIASYLAMTGKGGIAIPRGHIALRSQ